jgi:hypothetical protein
MPDRLFLPIPQNINWRYWADAVVGYNPTLIGQLSSDDEWREFADRLSRIYPETPRSTDFEDWEEWAEELLVALG